MNILVTGAAGFIGRNLVENLKNIRDGKNRTRRSIIIDEIYEYTRNSSAEELDYWCQKCDFVFNFAGVNRPKDLKEFKEGNVDFLSQLLETLKLYGNSCPLMLSSSSQASLAGRFGKSEYGLSKKKGEDLVFDYARDTGSPVFIYRFPNVVGKWVQPNYNSAVGTFCYNVANDLPVIVNDPTVELELLFIDDLLEEMYDALEGHPHRCDYPASGEIIGGHVYDGLTPIPRANGHYCYTPVTHKVLISYVVDCLYRFREQIETLMIPPIPYGSFEKKLYSMYVSYLPKDKVLYNLKMNCDDRGSFTELMKTLDYGQLSVNVSKPGITKGEHWHNSKWELFIVVSGHGLIQERKLGTNEVLEFEVSGDRIQAVHMLPGYTHSIKNLSNTENLVTLIWASEIFDPIKPDTYFEKVL